MRERPRSGYAVAGRVPTLEARPYPSTGQTAKATGTNTHAAVAADAVPTTAAATADVSSGSYFTPHRRQRRSQQLQQQKRQQHQQQQQQQLPQRPHSFVGFSRSDAPGGTSVDFYSSRYNRGRNPLDSHTSGYSRASTTIAGRSSVLKQNRSSDDVRSEAATPSLYRDILTGSPSLYREAVVTPGRSASALGVSSVNRVVTSSSSPPGREVSPYRSQSVATNRSYRNHTSRDNSNNRNSNSRNSNSRNSNNRNARHSSQTDSGVSDVILGQTRPATSNRYSTRADGYYDSNSLEYTSEGIGNSFRDAHTSPTRGHHDSNTNNTTNNNNSSISSYFQSAGITGKYRSSRNSDAGIGYRATGRRLSSSTASAAVIGGGGGGGGGGVVTFQLPENVSDGLDVLADTDHQIDHQYQGEGQDVYGQFSAAAYRRMSTPELPPIAAENVSAKTGGQGRTPRGEKKKPHKGTGRVSINQLSAAVTSKSYYNRRASGQASDVTPPTVPASLRKSKKRTGAGAGGSSSSGIPRNHSDSSLKGLGSVAQTSNQSQGSGGSTVNSYPTGTGEGGGSSTSGGGGGSSGVRQVKFLSNGSRALSWCATDNSGSQSKLETLFEGQNSAVQDTNNNISTNSNNNNNSNSNISGSYINNNNNNNNSSNGVIKTGAAGESNASLNGTSGYHTGISVYVGGANFHGNTSSSLSPSDLAHKRSSSNNSINNIPGFGRDNSFGEMPAIVPQRSVSVNGLRSREDAQRLRALNRKLMSDDGDEEVGMVEEFAAKGSKMRRSQSENKLAARLNNPQSPTGTQNNRQTRASNRSLSRNLSVDRIDRLTSQSKPARKTVTPLKHAAGGTQKLRRVSSVSAINSGNNNNNNNNNNSNTNNSKVSRHRRGNNAITNENSETTDDVFDVDDETLEASTRLVEWLNVVNNVDEYDTDPKDTFVEYSDEPPQTDTAVHLVYGKD